MYWTEKDQPVGPRPTDRATANRLVVNFPQPFSSDRPWEIELLFERHFAAALGHFRIAVTDREGGATASVHPAGLEDQLFSARSQSRELDQATERQIRRHYVQTSSLLKEQRKPIDRLRASVPATVRTPVMKERAADHPRGTNRHHRGEYLQPKEQVQPAVPAVFASNDDSPPRDRLALARWLVSDQNPLVGRVTVNRAWREFFGTGIVRTAGDFGTQSEPPSHPELIDWAGTGFCSRRLVAQTSASPNRAFSGLSADRDNGTAGRPGSPAASRISSSPDGRPNEFAMRCCRQPGLTTRKIGGPSVYPPQPATITQMAYGNTKWNTSKGADRYRKSLYTFSKRTAPFAAYLTFGRTQRRTLHRPSRSQHNAATSTDTFK